MAAFTAAAADEVNYDFAAQNSDGVTVYYLINEDGNTVKVSHKDWDYNCYTGVLNVPATATDDKDNTYTVTGIGSYAFYECPTLVKVTLPETLTFIENNAFQGTKITNLTLPESVTSIGKEAFWSSEVVNINLPEGLTSIGENAFMQCENLQSIVIPGSLATISNGCFAECTKLASVKISRGVTTIDYSAFANCSSLNSVIIADSVTTIGNSAFQNCTSLKSIRLPRYITAIGDWAFEGCTALEYVRMLNDDPTSITLGGSVFKDVPMETCILIVPSGTIDAYRAADMQWDAFKTIHVGENADFSVTTDGQKIYYIVNQGENTVSVTYTTRSGSYSGKVNIPETVTFDLVTYTVTGIGDYAFANSTGLTEVTIPATVTYIGQEAFSGCSGLGDVVIPNTVRSIGTGAFQNCTSIKTMFFPPSVRVISENICRGCTSLEEINISGYAGATIQNYAFFECPNIKKVLMHMTNPPTLHMNDYPGLDVFNAGLNYTLYIPQGSYDAYYKANWNVTNQYYLKLWDFKVGNFYFKFNPMKNWTTASVTYYDENYNSYSGAVSIPSTVTYKGSVYYVWYVGSSAFKDCVDLTSVTLPESILNIGEGAFSGCTKLAAVKLPDQVAGISDAAFSGCTALATVELPANSLKTIGENAFNTCSKLPEITIPASVTNIGAEAFGMCSALESVKVENEDPANINLGDKVFNGVDKGECVLLVPDGTKTLYSNAAQWKEFFTIREFSESGIEDIVVDGMIRNNVYYDLSGRRVQNPTHGLYILNGRKVFVK